MATYPYAPYQQSYAGFNAYSPYPPIPQPPVQQPQFAPQPSPAVPPQGQPGFVCCPVTSKEEAVAYRVEAFGPAVVMPDLGHGMIYFKRFNNNTALADFAEFQLVPEAQKQQTQPLDLPAIFGSFQNRFDAMESKMDAIAERLESRTPPKPTAQKGSAKNE